MMVTKQIFGARRGRWELSWLPALLVAAGCGASELPLSEVEGTILLDGQPLANAIVEFQPQGPAGKGQPSVGETGPDGKYRLRFSRDRWGAVVGPHKVMITTFSPDGEGQFKERVPPEYNTGTTLECNVAREANWLDFDLLSAGQAPAGAGQSLGASNVVNK